MRSKKRTTAATAGAAAAAGALSKSIVTQSLSSHPNHRCFEGESLARFLKSIQREIESARELDTALPHKFWIKQQFAVGVNEVTRVLERMPASRESRSSSDEHLATSLDDSAKSPSVYLQAILLASDCNPRWLTKHLPALAASRNVPLIFVKDTKKGSLRLGELIKVKTAIAIGIKAKGSDVNRLIKEVLVSDKIDDIEN